MHDNYVQAKYHKVQGQTQPLSQGRGCINDNKDVRWMGGSELETSNVLLQHDADDGVEEGDDEPFDDGGHWSQ